MTVGYVPVISRSLLELDALRHLQYTYTYTYFTTNVADGIAAVILSISGIINRSMRIACDSLFLIR